MYHIPERSFASRGFARICRTRTDCATDFKLVGWSNRYDIPYYPCALTRFEISPVEQGEALADLLIKRLSGVESEFVFSSVRFIN